MFDSLQDHLGRRVLLLAVSLATLAPAGLASSPAPPAPVSRHTSAQEALPLDALLTPRAGQDLSIAGVTARLLKAGPAETAVFLTAFESKALRARSEGTSLKHLARLGARLREVPAKVATVIGQPEIPAMARADAIGVSLEILRRDPTERTLATLVALLERGHPIDSVGAARVSSGVIAVVTGLTSAGVGTDARFERLYSAAAPWLCVSVIDGIVASDDGDLVLRRLSSFLGRIPSVDGAVLNRIQLVAGRAPVHVDGLTRSRLADYLTDERAFARHESAAALGALGDRECIPSLIWLLEDPAPSVREAAHASLKKLTSMTIAGDPVRWRLWLSRQELWWETEGQELVERILVVERAELVEILRATCTKRLYQREIAPYLISLVERRDVESIEIGLSALGTLRAPSALPSIRALQSHPNALVRRRANAALGSYRHANISVPFSGPLRLSTTHD